MGTFHKKNKNKNHYKSRLHAWGDVLKEVKQRRAKGQKASMLSDSDKEYEDFYAKRRKKQKAKRSFLVTTYGLGTKHDGVSFTRREAECMMWLLKGKSVDGIATTLGVSLRTVEQHIKNMKVKVDCRTRAELIDLVRASELLKSVDFAN